MEHTASKTHICLIGNGRLANQLRANLAHKSESFSSVSRAQNTHEEIAVAVKNATHIWLAVSDRAIETVYQTYSDSPNKTWVHFSGAHNFPNIFSVHPLMTFSGKVMPASEFEKVHLTISLPLDSSVISISLNDLMPQAQNPWSLLPAEKKAFYHALCVLAGNFPQILWSEVQIQLRLLSIPDRAFFSYLDQTLANFENEGADAVTGPLIRNDIETLKENLNSLDKHPFKAIYESFVKAKGITL